VPRPVNTIDPSLSAMMCFAGSALLLADAVANVTVEGRSVQGVVACCSRSYCFLAA
jgi:hypothetical protein